MRQMIYKEITESTLNTRSEKNNKAGEERGKAAKENKDENYNNRIQETTNEGNNRRSQQKRNMCCTLSLAKKCHYDDDNDIYHCSVPFSNLNIYAGINNCNIFIYVKSHKMYSICI